MNIIETHNLTRRFGRTEAVNDLNFTVLTGSICALLGANGAGKSTLIKLLLNLIKPTRGHSQVLGVDSRRLGAQEFAQIGYVSEGQQLPLWMTVRQFLSYCRPLYPTWDVQLERELMAQFELPENRKLEHLSRGMRMKAVLLSSLAYRPRLLLLDEPFSGLDPVVREEFIDGMLEVANSQEWSVLVATHDIAEVERLADRVVIVDRGSVQLDESVDSLLGRFRRVSVEGSGPAVAPDEGVTEWEQSGTLARFVATRYTDEKASAWRENFSANRVTAAPMSLREIFITLNRGQRKETHK
jgi:ABC-2 type transport system ATP-binding protein